MGYSPQVLRAARRRLEQARSDRESLYRAHLAQAYREEPRLQEIDRALRQTMAQAAQAVFTQGGDVEKSMEAARQENLALQRERQELLNTKFPPDFLSDKPNCPLCGDTGYVGSAMCRCLLALCTQEQRKELTLLHGREERFGDFRLDYYPDRIDSKLGVSPRRVMEKTYATCLQYAQTFRPGAENLLFSGDTGLGKTFLSACIAREVAERGYSVVYESAAHLFAKLERAKFASDEAARQDAEKYSACDLLILDDLGTELPGQFVTASLYTLLNDRLLSSKSTILSTNLNTEDLPRRYSPQIASRLRSFRRVAFLGEDIRILKSRER